MVAAAKKQAVKLPRATKSRASAAASTSNSSEGENAPFYPNGMPTAPSKPPPVEAEQDVQPSSRPAPSANRDRDSDSDSDSDSEDDGEPLLKIQTSASLPASGASRPEPSQSTFFNGDGPETSHPFVSLRRRTIQAEEFNVRALGDTRGSGNPGLAPLSTSSLYRAYPNGKDRQLSPQTATFPLSHSTYQSHSLPQDYHHSSASPHSYHPQPSIVQRMPTHPQSATIPSTSSFWPDEVSPGTSQTYQAHRLHPQPSHQQQPMYHHQQQVGIRSDPVETSVFDEYLRQHQQQTQQNGNGAQVQDQYSGYPAYGTATYSHLHTRHMSLPQHGIGLGMGNVPVMEGLDPKYFLERNSFSNDAPQQNGNGHQSYNNDYQRSYHSTSPFHPISIPEPSSHQPHSFDAYQPSAGSASASGSAHESNRIDNTNLDVLSFTEASHEHQGLNMDAYLAQSGMGLPMGL